MTVVEEYDPSLPLAQADPDQLLQVVLNLLKNAAEAAGDAGGRIILRSYYEQSLRVRRDNGAGRSLPLQIEIEDDGPACPRISPKKCSSPSSRAVKTAPVWGWRWRPKSCRDHGGWISVSSTPGKTVFRISLPRADEVPAGQDDKEQS